MVGLSSTLINSSPKVPFMWNDELDTLLNSSKKQIVGAIQEGVKIFDPRRTALMPDWSKTGIVFWLLQKYCQCANLNEFDFLSIHKGGC